MSRREAMALALARRATTSFHVSHDGEASTSGSPLDLDSVEAMLSHSLFAAVKIGDVKTVAAMVERGLHKDNAGDDRRCPRGATALHHAAGYGHVDVVRLLVERGGAELNSLCEIAGGTPLIWAASQNRREVVTLLLAYGADPGQPAVPSMLNATWVRKDSGTPLGETALMVAAQYGHPEICRMLCEHSRSLEKIGNAYGQTALHIAAIFGKSEAAAVLLDAGADPHFRDVLGSTPLLLCAERGHAETAFTLLWRGANVAARDFDGSSVAQVAASRGHAAVAELCDLWATGRLLDWSPLHHRFFPRAFREDVRSALLSTLGSCGRSRPGARGFLGVLSDCGALHHVFRKLLELHMVVPAQPVGSRPSSEAESLTDSLTSDTREPSPLAGK